MTLKKLTKYRDKNGRFAKRGRKEIWDVVTNDKGKVLAVNKIISSKVYFIRSKNVLDSPDPSKRGMISDAFRRMNLRGSNLQDARQIEITIQGKDYREKTKKIKLSLSVGEGTKPGRAQDYMIGAILGKLRERGFRTSYELDRATFHVQSVQKRSDGTVMKASRASSGKLKQLHDLDIIVKVIK